MKTRAGVWIDHRKAVIVTVSGHAETLLEILSGVESQPSREDGVPMDVHFESLLEKADDYQQSDYTEQLNQYYAKVDAAVHNATTLLVFGPGEAKGELKKRLEHAGSRRSRSRPSRCLAWAPLPSAHFRSPGCIVAAPKTSPSSNSPPRPSRSSPPSTPRVRRNPA